MPYEYFSDEKHLQHWLSVERSEAVYREFLEEYIFRTPDFSAYVDLCGGPARIEELRHQELHPDE